MSRETVFYVLVDPFTLAPRYVGKTQYGIDKRLYLHMWKETQLPSSKWIHGLKRKGATPLVYELERIPRTVDPRPVERFWVQYFNFIGADLTNRQYNGTDHLKGRVTRWTRAKG